MDLKYPALVLVCIAAVLMAGCTSQQPPAGVSAPASVSPSLTAGTPVDSGNSPTVCAKDDDCVPAQCCHPSSCTNRANKGVCNEMCTMNCAGPLDCGAGSCGCVRGSCRVVPSPTILLPAKNGTSIHVAASPQRYSPIMSSTPGIGLTPTASGFTASDAIFTWNASYGEFLSWNAPDYTVSQQKKPVTNHGEELYWSFIDKPASNTTPVIITISARDPGSGTLLGTSTVTLAWDGDYAVTVRDVQ